MDTQHSSSHSSPTHPGGRHEGRGRRARRHQVLVIGGGEAGLAVLDGLAGEETDLDVALVEPSPYRYAQRDWVRVATAGVAKERTRRPLLVPAGVTWVQERAASVSPDAQVVETDAGTRLSYDYLVVATGVEVLWHRILGLTAGLERPGVCSVYDYEQAERTWEAVRTFEGGRAIFTAPPGPYKGDETPLSLLRRAVTIWQQTGVRDATEVIFATAEAADDARVAYEGAASQGVHIYFGHELIRLRPDVKEAVFSVRKGNTWTREVVPYDLIHVVPPMRPPEVIRTSALAYRDGLFRGYLEVEPETLRHRHYETVYGVGDAVGVRGQKTGEQARRQGAELARHLRDVIGPA